MSTHRATVGAGMADASPRGFGGAVNGLVESAFRNGAHISMVMGALQHSLLRAYVQLRVLGSLPGAAGQLFPLHAKYALEPAQHTCKFLTL